MLELVVPLIALIDHTMKPEVDRADDIGEAHAGTLGEVAELMGEHPAELAHFQAGSQGQADGEHQVIAHETAQAAAEAGGGVDLVVDVDSARFG